MSDYMFILESHLDAGQSRVVAEMQRLATEATMNVWLTGGAMRDVLRGSRVLDLDFTVERDAIKIGKHLVAALGGTVIADDPLKRWTEVELASGVRASVSNARIEKYAKPGGKPVIEAATIREDLLRRDFTINAIGLALNRGTRGLLIDPANGQADIQNKELRAANPYIFFDDPKRIYRMIRFQHSLGYEVAPRLKSQLENALLEGHQEHAPVSALIAEIRALSGGPNAVLGLEEYDRCGVLAFISKALTGAKLNAAGLAKLEQVAASVPVPPEPAAPGGWIAFLTVLLEKLNETERAEALKAFELPKGEVEALKHLGAETTTLETKLKASGVVKASVVYEAVSEASRDAVLMTLYSTTQRNVPDRINAHYEKYLPMAEEVTEDQVAEASGAKPGTPKFEKAFKAAVTAHLNARPKKVVEPEEAAETETAPPVVTQAGRAVKKGS